MSRGRSKATSAVAARIPGSWPRCARRPGPGRGRRVAETREPDSGPEAERYELFARPGYRFDLGRRDFCKILGGGLVVTVALDPAFARQESGGARRGSGDAMPREIGAWLHVAADGAVTIYTGKAEMGQNIRTSLAQVVAEELRVPLPSITMVMADTALTPFDMGTFGSRTTPYMAPQLRRAAAAARELLIGLAAEKWAVDRGSGEAADGGVRHPPTRRSLSFGELTQGQRLAGTIGGGQPTIPPPRWTLSRRSRAQGNGRDLGTGKHKYTSD